MKKYFIIPFIIFLLGLFSSCKDIINSDENINKYSIDYTYVLTDQTKSVIMPLHEGNTWIYQITEYDLNGIVTKQSLDTIFVSKEITLNNEIWFEVVDKMFNYTDSTVMVNTDLGLWYKCNPCDSMSYLEAQYPLKNSPYYAGENYFDFFYRDSTDSLVFVSETINRMANFENVSKVNIPAGTFDCIKYTNWFESKILSKAYNPSYVRYYVPDLGMIREEHYVNRFNNSSCIVILYELISYKLYE